MFNLINIEQCMSITGYTKPYLQRILSEAGVTKFGKSNNYLKDEFYDFFRNKSKPKQNKKDTIGIYQKEIVIPKIIKEDSAQRLVDKIFKSGK